MIALREIWETGGTNGQQILNSFLILIADTIDRD